MQPHVDTETYEAKVRAGLFTVQELAPEYYIAEELDPIKAPKMCDLFTAEELDEYPHDFTCMIPEEWTIKRNPQYESDRDKLRKLYEEADRRKSVWLVDRKAKTLQLGE